MNEQFSKKCLGNDLSTEESAGWRDPDDFAHQKLDDSAISSACDDAAKKLEFNGVAVFYLDVGNLTEPAAKEFIDRFKISVSDVSQTLKDNGYSVMFIAGSDIETRFEMHKA